mgnify:CR=1 FL=1
MENCMRYSEARTGRTYVIRFDDGDRLPDVIEQFAAEHRVLRAVCVLVGGIDDGGRIVVGPEEADASPINPMIHELEGVHEVSGVGTIFPDEEGKPKLHMHAALGREGLTRTGCIRTGVQVWKLGECVMTELVENRARRVRDPQTGFEVMEP